MQVLIMQELTLYFYCTFLLFISGRQRYENKTKYFSFYGLSYKKAFVYLRRTFGDPKGKKLSIKKKILKIISNEKNVSTFKEKKTKQAWF